MSKAILGDCIRILLVSDAEGDLDRAIESLESEGAAIVAKEIKAEPKEVAKLAASMMSRGKYDIIIALTGNPFAANIAFNKSEGTSAAVCASAENVAEAVENGANVIVVGWDATGRLADMLDAVLESYGGGKVHRQPAEAVVHEEKVPEERHVQHVHMQPKSGIGALIPRGMFRHHKPKEQEREEFVQGPKREGIIGAIKDELGIVDVEVHKKKEKEPKKQ